MIVQGDCVALMAELAEGSVDAVVTDPPYGLEFMGKEWDAPWSAPPIGDADGTPYRRNTGTPGWNSGTGSNPSCRNCGGDKYRRGPRKCSCANPDFGNPGAVQQQRASRQMRAYQDWCEAWAREALRILKPGGHLLAFGGSRTIHRLTSGLEDAGFEIRDMLSWLYGSGLSRFSEVSQRREGHRLAVSRAGLRGRLDHSAGSRAWRARDRSEAVIRASGYGA